MSQAELALLVPAPYKTAAVGRDRDDVPSAAGDAQDILSAQRQHRPMNANRTDRTEDRAGPMPSPSSPDSFEPHAITSPRSVTKTVKPSPALICAIRSGMWSIGCADELLRRRCLIGFSDASATKVPSCPDKLRPHDAKKVRLPGAMAVATSSRLTAAAAHVAQNETTFCPLQRRPGTFKFVINSKRLQNPPALQHDQPRNEPHHHGKRQQRPQMPEAHIPPHPQHKAL